MNTLARIIASLGVAALATTATATAHAAERRVDALRDGFYVAPMVSLLLVDKGRQTDNGRGAMLALGYTWNFASIELAGEYFRLKSQAPQDNPNVLLKGGGVNALIHPIPVFLLNNLYAAVSFGGHYRQNHPGFEQDSPPGGNKNQTSFFFGAGAGYLLPLRLFGWDFAIRAEWHYRLDSQPPPHQHTVTTPGPPFSTTVTVPEPEDFKDHLINVGLYIPLSHRPEPPPAPVEPAPVLVPPTVADADHDGVPDDRDQCPDTPAGSTVDEHGCVPALVPEKIVLDGVNFDTAKATLTADSATVLDGVAAKLTARPELRVEIGGHTDNQGSEKRNQKLSEQRAQSVRTYLVAHGVAADRMTAVGYGQSQPLVSNHTPEGRQQNRRVEIKTLK